MSVDVACAYGRVKSTSHVACPQMVRVDFVTIVHPCGTFSYLIHFLCLCVNVKVEGSPCSFNDHPAMLWLWLSYKKKLTCTYFEVVRIH